MFKKISYVFIILFSIMIFSSYVYADCSDEEYKKYKEEADKIKVTYKHLDNYQTEEGPSNYKFEVKVKNISNDFYVMIMQEQYVPSDNLVDMIIDYGNWNFKVYTNSCEKELKTIKVNLPKYNVYYGDKLCEGIDEKKFPLCGKYYNYSVSREEFVKRVNAYKVNNKNSQNGNDNDNLFVIALNYIINNAIYFGIGFILLIISIVIIVFINKRKKRGVLK